MLLVKLIKYLQDEAAHLLDLFPCRLVVHVCGVSSGNSLEKKRTFSEFFIFYFLQFRLKPKCWGKLLSFQRSIHLCHSLVKLSVFFARL